jgi:hypothetical protein
MRDLLNIIDDLLLERGPVTGTAVTKDSLKELLRKNGYTEFKDTGNKLQVLVQIPDGAKKEEFRVKILQEILALFKQTLPADGPEYSNDATLSSIGGIVFVSSPVKVLVKDVGKQGDQSAGVANELELASIIQSVVDKYGSANVSFVDPRGKTLKLDNVTEVDVSGRSTVGRKKADVVLRSKSGDLPISIKKLDADMWESADNLFGQRAKEILEKLIADGVVTLEKIKERQGKPVYKLSKEIVMEPTEQESLNAIFGSDLNPRGGVVIQTFKPEHFRQEGNEVTVEAHAVIAKKSDIPESHLMVWILRNDSDRNSASLGIAGIRPLGVTLTRGIGKKGTKDVILVDVNGNVVRNPNLDKSDISATVDDDDLKSSKDRLTGPGVKASKQKQEPDFDEKVTGRKKR